MSLLDEDLSEVREEDMEGTWRALPSGDYAFTITDSDYKDTKGGDGKCLHLLLECVEPDRSAKLRDFLTLRHPNSDTVRIAKARLKSIAIAVGHPNPDYVKRSEELHNIPMLCRVSREEAEEPKYGDVDGWRNRIVSYKPMDGRGTVDPPADSGPSDQDEPPPPSDDDIGF